MNAQAQRVDVRKTIATVIADMRASGDTGMVENLLEADAAIGEMIERDRIAQEVFTCILRGVNDLCGPMGYRSEPFVSGWLQQWAKSMNAAGFTPLDPAARDICSALARIGGVK